MKYILRPLERHACWYTWLKIVFHGLNVIIIQISYTVRILIFWLVDFCHVTLSYDETTALTSLSWCNSRGVNSIYHCLCTLASGDSKFDDLSEADIDSLIADAIPKNTKKATAWGISLLKGKVANFKFLIHASWTLLLSVVSSFADFEQNHRCKYFFLLFVF